MEKLSKIFVVLALLLFSTTCSALSYDELYSGIEVEGLVHTSGDVLCTAKVLPRAQMRLFEQDVFEKPYTLGILDVEGELIDSYEFPVAFVETAEVTEQDLEIIPFNLIVPYYEGTSFISIVDPEGVEKCLIIASLNWPEIEITSPSTGAWNSVKRIEWSMSDGDDDWLLVDVYVAGNDGYGWQLVEEEVDGTYLQLLKPVDATRVKVVVNDGFNTGESIVESSVATGDVYANVVFEEASVTWSVADDAVLDPSFLNYGPKIGVLTPPPEPPGPDQPPIQFDFTLIIILVIILIIAGFIYKNKGKSGFAGKFAKANEGIEKGLPAIKEVKEGLSKGIKDIGGKGKEISKKAPKSAGGIRKTIGKKLVDMGKEIEDNAKGKKK